MTSNATQPKGPNLAKIAEALDAAAGEFTIIDELRDLLDAPREEEFKELKASIEAEGIRDPLIIWKEKNAIVDGHTRNKIAKLLEMPKDKIPRIEKSFTDIDAVKEWMLRNQLGRRNLTPQRFDYYIGKLYNQTKGTKKDGEGVVSTEIAKQFGVSERTVRRAGDVAKGIDKLEQVKGKLAKINQLDGKGDYDKAELTTIGKASNSTVAKKVMEKLDAGKQQAAAKKEENKQQAKAAAVSPTLYGVVFCEPDFDAVGFNVNNEPKPPLDQNAILYMACADEHIFTACKLMEKWGLDFEGTFVYKLAASYEGVFTKVCHTFMIIGTKGVVTGPNAGQEQGSIINGPGEVEAKMTGLIDLYHKKGSKLYLGKNKTPQGWAVLAK
jgi:hypothetical protein